MLAMMMMRMRMKTIRDIINKSRMKIKVVMIMWIELVTAKYRTLQFGDLNRKS